MLYITGAGRKFQIAPERFIGPQHAEKRKPEDQRKKDADDAGPAHTLRPYIRPSSNSITSAQVVTEGRELTATPRLFAIS